MNGIESVLPKEGTVTYHPGILSSEEAKFYFAQLWIKIDWKPDQVLIFGKKIITKRKMAWYGDEAYSYSYAHISRKAQPWIPELLVLKEWIERESGETYNSCLLNLYHDGSESMGWHSDAEKELKKGAAIASLSLGAARRFSFKHKASKETRTLVLESGSLLVMKGSTQDHWWHALPPSRKVAEPRINLSFRTIIPVERK